jgi:hypothetical protein
MREPRYDDIYLEGTAWLDLVAAGLDEDTSAEFGAWLNGLDGGEVDESKFLLTAYSPGIGLVEKK